MKHVTLAVLIFCAAVSAQTWKQQYKLSSPDQTGTDSFAKGVAIDGNTAVVGALGASGNGFTGTGAAYVFVGGVQVAKLTPSDGGGNLNFGASVGISGDTIVVGARGGANKKIWTAGGAYIFVKPASGWQDATETVKLMPSDHPLHNYFGFAQVAIEGQTVIFTWQSVAAYVFDGTQGWQQVAKLSVPAYSVAISNGIIAVGDPSFKNNEGAVYLFQNFSQLATLTASDTESALGGTVYINGNTVVAGAYTGSGTLELGRAYVFQEPNWVDSTQTAILSGPHNKCACVPLATDGTNVVTAGIPGHALVYKEPLKGWHNMPKATGSLRGSDKLPYLYDAVAMQKGLAIVGMFNFSHPGAAYVFSQQ